MTRSSLERALNWASGELRCRKGVIVDELGLARRNANGDVTEPDPACQRGRKRLVTEEERAGDRLLVWV